MRLYLNGTPAYEPNSDLLISAYVFGSDFHHWGNFSDELVLYLWN